MKQLLRIIIGLPLLPFVMFLGTCVWICTDDEDWMEGVGTHAWYLASGQWNKLPE